MKSQALKSLCFCVALVLASAVFNPLPAFGDPTQPWALRNLYKIPVERGVLVYAEDNAEWRVLLDNGDVLADRIGFQVVLEDGTELTEKTLGIGQSGRERYSSPLGDGMVYSVTFPVNHGLRVVHTLRTFQSRPFVFIEISVENTGTADARITEIRPVASDKAIVQALGPQARLRYRHVLDIGGQPVPAPREDATMAVFYDPAKPISLGLGLIPRGLARSSVQFTESGGEWKGGIACRYEPYKTLKPGETLLSDPLWISHGVPEPDRVDLNYSWVYSTMVDVPARKFEARGWFTMGEGDGIDAYLSAGSGWKTAGVDHVLLGRGWEGRPGSMEGAGGRFPKNMKTAVDSLTQAGLQVGVTIDLLSAHSAGDGWTTTSSGGLAWLDPRQADGVKALKKKADTLKEWGISFAVADYSQIPDESLSALGLTRMEAQNLAYAAFRAAADPLPVFPSSISSVAGSLEEWLDAGSSVARMAVYGMTPGPLHCVLDGHFDVTPDVVTAVQFWPGPIEFSGKLAHKYEDGVLELVKQQRVPGQPMDAENDAPHTWNVQKYDTSGNLVEERTISISGARGERAKEARADTKASRSAS